MSAFPECDFFCEHTGRLSVFPSSCGTAEQLFAADCTCAEAPITQNPSCLQSICTPQQFAALVAAEEARCGSGSVPSAAGSADSIVRRGASLSLGEDLLQSTDGHTASLFILVPLVFVLLALGAAVRVYSRRRALHTVRIADHAVSKSPTGDNAARMLEEISGRIQQKVRVLSQSEGCHSRGPLYAQGKKASGRYLANVYCMIVHITSHFVSAPGPCRTPQCGLNLVFWSNASEDNIDTYASGRYLSSSGYPPPWTYATWRISCNTTRSAMLTADLPCDFRCRNATDSYHYATDKCDTGDISAAIARSCTCSESPILVQNVPCLQSMCSQQEFSSLVDAEQARCFGASVATGGAPSAPADSLEPQPTPAPSFSSLSQSSSMPPVSSPSVASTSRSATSTKDGSQTSSTPSPTSTAPVSVRTSSSDSAQPPNGSGSGTNLSLEPTPSSRNSIPSGTQLITTALASIDTSARMPSIVKTSSQPASSATASTASSSPHHLASDEIALPIMLGIVIAVVAGLLLLRRRRQSRADAVLPSVPVPPTSPIPATEQTYQDEIDYPKILSFPAHNHALSDAEPADEPCIQGPSRTASAYSRPSQVIHIIDHDYSTRADNGRPSRSFTPPSDRAEQIPQYPSPFSPTQRDEKAYSDALRAPPCGPTLPTAPDIPISQQRRPTDAPPSQGPSPPSPPAPPPPPPPPISPPTPRAAPHPRIIISHPAPHTETEERVVVLPWPLGERLLAFLANAPSSGVGGGVGGRSVSDGGGGGGSEPLPAYEPRSPGPA